MIGDIPDVPVGQWFPNRRAAHDAGVHRPLQAGICGTKATGAESIVVSGGYPDDRDYGDVIVYTGHGGRDPETKRQIADQTLEDPGNAALVTSYLEGLPVRVVRGAHAGSKHAPAQGYRYDGLFQVASYGSTRGMDGFLIWQFSLEALQPARTAPASDAEAEEQPAAEPSARRATTVQRIVRSGAVTRQVKQWHNDCCQICAITLTVPGGMYSEGAHIQALGAPHNGPDITANVLCLCPNCHVLFDAGALVLTDDLTVMSGNTVIGALRQDPRHSIGIAYVQSHRARWRR